MKACGKKLAVESKNTYNAVPPVEGVPSQVFVFSILILFSILNNPFCVSDVRVRIAEI